jgi:hypothetical protein
MKRLMPAVVLLLALPAAAAGRRGWFVECAGGFSALAPADLNARLEGRQARTDFLYRDGYLAQQRAAGGAYAYVLEEPAGSGLRPLRGGFPLGLRLGRALGPRIAVFAGLQFLQRRRSSGLEQVHRIDDRRPDQVTAPGAYSFEVSFPEFFLSARAWSPQLGVFVELWRRRPWSGGVRLAAGPMFAAVRVLEEQRTRLTEADGYWSESQQVFDLRGRGSGVSAEAMARLRLELSRRLALHLEGGYALRRAGRFSGAGRYEYQYRDRNAARDPQRQQWQGEWRVWRERVQREWGVLEYDMSGNDAAAGTPARPFRLDLSGWEAAVGLALAL